MTKIAQWPSDEVLFWLKNFLLDRLGYSFTFNRVSTYQISISSEFNEGKIFFLLNADLLSANFINLGFSFWDAQKEGYFYKLSSTLPAPGLDKYDGPLIKKQNQDYFIQYDLLGIIYWALCRLEEIGATNLDEHGRFPASFSHAYRHNYLERPFVDEWIYILEQVIKKVWPELQLKKYRFELQLSHDVDSPSRYIFSTKTKFFRTILGDLFKRKSIKSALYSCFIRLNKCKGLHKLDPDNTFDWLMDLSEAHGLRSTFYFLAGRTDPVRDASYEINDPVIGVLLKKINTRGHYIGLHPSYKTFNCQSAIADELHNLKTTLSNVAINQKELGVRMHYLRWEHPFTMRSLDNLGVTHDASLGYADKAGFRCGTCFEYSGFDPIGKQLLNIRIRPLVAMDCTIVEKKYMALGETEGALEKLLSLRRACMAVNGKFTLLWHNSYLDTEMKKYIYENVVKL